MKRILQWLVFKLAHPISTGTDAGHESGRKELDDGRQHAHRVVTRGGKNRDVDELMPDIYGEHTVTHDANEELLSDDDTQTNLQIIEEPQRSPESSKGFDPYNSGDYKVLKK